MIDDNMKSRRNGHVVMTTIGLIGFLSIEKPSPPRPDPLTFEPYIHSTTPNFCALIDSKRPQQEFNERRWE
ncbi:Uncharacterized protein TCM_015023 [Theobroma cacao]|uniref:Uncharacterized protein n=1 Tax=Theobroma cacao TaxID=3641 RepID=A0A061G7I9_THECC|nr:Uncharacterized protein TCM_015023 [Theobroma cacao]